MNGWDIRISEYELTPFGTGILTPKNILASDEILNQFRVLGIPCPRLAEGKEPEWLIREVRSEGDATKGCQSPTQRMARGNERIAGVSLELLRDGRSDEVRDAVEGNEKASMSLSSCGFGAGNSRGSVWHELRVQICY